MSASNTTVPAAETALEALLTAAVEEPTEVWPGRPVEDHQLEENVYLGEVRGSRAWHSMPALTARAREEHYEITVDIEVYRQGTDVAGVKARLWEVVFQCEGAVAANPTLGDSPRVKAALAGRFSKQTTAMADGVLAAYSFGVNVDARL